MGLTAWAILPRTYTRLDWYSSRCNCGLELTSDFDQKWCTHTASVRLVQPCGSPIGTLKADVRKLSVFEYRCPSSLWWTMVTENAECFRIWAKLTWLHGSIFTTGIKCRWFRAQMFPERLLHCVVYSEAYSASEDGSKWTVDDVRKRFLNLYP